MHGVELHQLGCPFVPHGHSCFPSLRRDLDVCDVTATLVGVSYKLEHNVWSPEVAADACGTRVAAGGMLYAQ